MNRRRVGIPGDGEKMGKWGLEQEGTNSRAIVPTDGTMRGDLEESQKARWSLLLRQHL